MTLSVLIVMAMMVPAYAYNDYHYIKFYNGTQCMLVYEYDHEQTDITKTISGGKGMANTVNVYNIDNYDGQPSDYEEDSIGAWQTPVFVKGAIPFLGWSTSADASTLDYPIGEWVPALTERSYYAVWQEAAPFDVTLPASLPVTVDAKGNTITADDVVISNAGTSNVFISSMTVTPASGWRIVSEAQALASAPNNNVMSLSFMGSSCASDGTVNVSSFPRIPAGESIPFDYEAVVPISTVGSVSESAATAVIVVKEETAEPAMLASGDTWFAGSMQKSAISQISVIPLFDPDSNSITEGMTLYEQWDSSDAQDGSITTYAYSEDGTAYTLVIAGNGAKSIIANPDSTGIFTEFSGVESISGLGYLDTSNTVNMSRAFYGCSSLKSVAANSWDMSKVQDAEEMFYGCSSITSLNLSKWDISSLTNAAGMIGSCTALESLALSGWDTTNIPAGGLDAFAADCPALTKIALGEDFGSTANLSQAGSGTGLFYADTLTETTVTGANNAMLAYDWAADNRDVTFPELEVAYAMLYDDGSLVFQRGNVPDPDKTLAASYTDFENTIYGSQVSIPWYSQRGNIKSVSFKDTIAPLSTAYWFSNASALETFDGTNLDTKNTYMTAYMFYNCSSLTDADVSGFNTSNVYDMKYTFYGCSALPELDLSGWDYSAVKYMTYMFGNCGSLSGTYSFDAPMLGSKENGYYVYGMFQGAATEEGALILVTGSDDSLVATAVATRTAPTDSSSGVYMKMTERTLAVSPSELEIPLGTSGEYVIHCTIYNSTYISNADTQWESSDETVVRLNPPTEDAERTFTALKAGTATITYWLTDVDGTRYEASCQVTVTEAGTSSAALSLEFDPETGTIGGYTIE